MPFQNPVGELSKETLGRNGPSSHKVVCKERTKAGENKVEDTEFEYKIFVKTS